MRLRASDLVDHGRVFVCLDPDRKPVDPRVLARHDRWYGPGMNGVLQGLVSAGLLLVAACGDAPLPAAPPPPRAFDDPFADEAGAPEPAGEVVGAAKIPADTPEPALLAEPREPAISPGAAAPSEPAAAAPSEPVAAAPATSPRSAKGKPRAGEGPAPKDTSPVASTAAAAACSRSTRPAIG